MGLIDHALPLLSSPSRPGSLGGFVRKGWGTFFGFGLVDTILSLALMVALSAGAWVLFGPTTTASAVSQESHRLDVLVQAIPANHNTGTNFADLPQAAPSVPDLQPNDSAWGQPFSVLPAQVKQSADGWMATYQGVPADVCTELGVPQINLLRWYAVQVDGVAVNDGNALRSACTTPIDSTGLHELQFVWYGGPRHQGVNNHDCFIDYGAWCGALR